MLHISYAGTKGKLSVVTCAILSMLLPFVIIACGNTTPTPVHIPTPARAPAAPISLLSLPAPRYTYEKQINISYGPLPEEKLDLCYPTDARGVRPGILIIHGGGWTRGDKQGLGGDCANLARQGFVVGNINYRLATNKQPATQWPAPLVDAQLAVRWLRAQAGNLNMDPQRLCAWGTSAGAHLAVFLGALKTIHPGDEAELLVEQSPSVSCVVDYFGPTDLTQKFPLLTSQIATMFGKATLQSDPLLYRDASPIFSIAADTAPMFIVQGTQDTTVPPSQSLMLLRALQQYKIPVQYISYNGGHSFYGLSGRQHMSIYAQLYDYLIKLEHP